jgi:hypothetical protein
MKVQHRISESIVLQINIYTRNVTTKATKKCNGMKSETYHRGKQKITKKQIDEQHGD